MYCLFVSFCMYIKYFYFRLASASATHTVPQPPPPLIRPNNVPVVSHSKPTGASSQVAPTQ